MIDKGGVSIMPSLNPQNPDARQRINLRKTLMLRYDTPGELGFENHQVVELSEQVWIMR